MFLELFLDNTLLLKTENEMEWRPKSVCAAVFFTTFRILALQNVKLSCQLCPNAIMFVSCTDCM